jgi:hypothetical protein
MLWQAEGTTEEDGELPADVWLYSPTGPAVQARDMEAAADTWTDATFLVKPGRSGDPTAVSWVWVKAAKWRCSVSLHRGSAQEPCRCMNIVMDALALTAEDLAEAAADAALGAAVSRLTTECLVVSSLPRTLRLQRHEACRKACCIPEDIVAAIGEHVDVAALEAGPGEVALAALGVIFQELRCPAHSEPYVVTRHRARVMDGTNALQYCDVFSVSCTAAGDGCCKHVYDGNQDDMFNLNNSELFTHKMLINNLFDIRYKGCSFNAIREVMMVQQRVLPLELQECIVSLPLLIRAFFGFLEILTDLPGFTCKICGEYPAAIIADGTGYKVFDSHLQPLESFGHPTHGELPRTSGVGLFPAVFLCPCLWMCWMSDHS